MSCHARNAYARDVLLADLRNRLRERRLLDTIEALEHGRPRWPCFAEWTPPCACACRRCFAHNECDPIEYVVSVRPRPSLC